MKKIFVSLTLLVMPLSLYAQEKEENKGPMRKVEMPIFCTKTEIAEKFIQQQKESAVFVGVDKIHEVENLTVNIFRNENTGTYTIAFLSLDKDLVCVLSAGEKAKFIYNY